MEEKTRVKLKICENEFIITADESEKYIHSIAKQVDSKIKQNNENNEKMSLLMATILAALNYCDELEKERKITKELLKKADSCEASAKKANADFVKFAIENAQLIEEKKGLHKVIEELKEKLDKLGAANSSDVTAKNITENTPTQSASSSPRIKKDGFRPQKPTTNPYTTKPTTSHIPKINYQRNDKIDNQYKRKEFDDSALDDETLSFFDHRDS